MQIFLTMGDFELVFFVPINRFFDVETTWNPNTRDLILFWVVVLVNLLTSEEIESIWIKSIQRTNRILIDSVLSMFWSNLTYNAHDCFLSYLLQYIVYLVMFNEQVKCEAYWIGEICEFCVDNRWDPNYSNLLNSLLFLNKCHVKKNNMFEKKNP